MNLEVAAIPGSDVDRAKEFYGRLGWRLDADLPFDNGFRVVQFTPAGSGCSIQFGTKITSAELGSAEGLYLIVPDIAAARDLASALRRAAAAHGGNEKHIGAADPGWPDWNAAYMVAEQAGTELPT